MQPTASVLRLSALLTFAFYATVGCTDRAVDSQASSAAPDGAPAALAERAPPTPTPNPSPADGGGGGGKMEDSAGLLEDAWYALYLDSVKAGHRHIAVWKTARDGKTLTEIAGREVMRIVRDGTEATIEFQCISRSDEEGVFLEAEYRLPDGLDHGWKRAVVDGESLHIRPKSDHKVATTIPWPEDARGPYAVGVSLRKRPLRPGETRSLRFFDPALGQVTEASLTAKDWELTQLSGGADRSGSEYRLLPIDVLVRLPNDSELASRVWTDEHGIVWKESQRVGVEITAFRTSKENALAVDANPPTDLFRNFLVPVTPPIDRPRKLAEIVYRVTVAEGDPAKLFVDDVRQDMESARLRQVQLVVRAGAAPGQSSPGEPTTDVDRPTAADTAASSAVDSDDAKIRELSTTVVPKATDAAVVARALEQLVFQIVQEKSYGSVFASAGEVLASREGDCTEHSVLFVALCRARGIPARAAMGLVYSEAHQAFAYHMWTEVWDGGQWLGLDATRARGQIGPTHLKMANSSLAGPAALIDMVTVMQAARGLEIEVVSTRGH